VVDAAALKASWALVAAQGDEAAEVFYAVLFTSAPKLRGMFPPSMAAQRDRLLHALGHIVSNVDDTGLLTGFAAQLGRDHRKYGVLAEHYPIVGQALVETLRRALGSGWTPALAADWAAAYQTVARVMRDAAQQAAGSMPAWWLAEVTGVQRRAPEITVFTVRPDYPYDYLPGQSAAVESERRPRVWRYLSPANAPRPDGCLEFHVRAVPGGMLSPALVYQLQVGDTVKLGPPVGHTLTGYRHTDRDLLLIAGGTGLAPLRAIVEDLAATGTGRAVTLIVGASTAAGLYDLDHLRHLAVRLPRLSVVAAVAHGPLRGARRGDAVDVALGAGRWAGHDIYLCGSPGMLAGTRARLVAAGYPAPQIRSEDYTQHVHPTVMDHALRR
jgi:NAD(P)H-flavin reductase/hemoglobin-like flavoprotein